MPTTKTVREGSAPKRAAILSAARALFLSAGFDRTSVDAVAARAQVSKRTVYDYFGDKQTLGRAVIETTAESLLTTVRRTLDETLTDVTAADQLEDALITFSTRITTDMLDSEEYSALQRLVHNESTEQLRPGNPLADVPEEALGQRFAALARMGLLDITDARLAADHFLALTFGVALSRLGSVNATEDTRVQPLIAEGVRTFLRAYRSG
ncbi:putative transcriptional regulator, TetR family [Nocardia nova SH22a]|uniref:Putative transcriptional regulator, TetR family n=1 Tax=Nocardia nova SH22a TaxID=1415166 RepID=W5TQ22_9NOCA|nr:TetR/AcrR family transcriptional regulator [Nocardia nova]AHH21460.1 putative transcriptional regulator, TetR family [Nocardia nova SH22a]